MIATSLSACSLWPVVLTLGVYLLAVKIRNRWSHPVLNPILVSFVIILLLILVLDLPDQEYQAGWEQCSWLLTPATICLALPLYQQLQVLKGQLKAILVGITAGTLAGLGTILLLCRLTGLERAMTVSLLPKSITTALGIALAEQMGGYAGITTAAIIVTGIGGSIIGDFLCKVLRIKGEVAQGVAFGTAAHVVGTSRASEISPLTGAVSSLSLVVAGILTALILPFIPLG